MKPQFQLCVYLVRGTDPEPLAILSSGRSSVVMYKAIDFIESYLEEVAELPEWEYLNLQPLNLRDREGLRMSGYHRYEISKDLAIVISHNVPYVPPTNPKEDAIKELAKNFSL